MSLNQLEQELSYHEVAKQKKPILKWILVFFIICFSIIILGGGFLIWTMLFRESNSVTISLQTDTNISRGIPFTMTAIVANEQDIAISNTKLSITLPDGIREANSGGTIISEPIGTVQGNTSVKRNFSLVMTNEKDVIGTIVGRASYIGGNNNRFESNEEKINLKATKEPLSIAIALPDSIVRGVPFSFEIQFGNQSNADIRNLFLIAEYPELFHFNFASIHPDSLNNRWLVPILKRGEIQSIEISGTYDGDESVPFIVPASLILSLGDRDFVVASSKSSKEAQPSPVLLQILVNGSNQYIAKAGDTLSYNIQYENRTGVALKNTTITLSLSGDMIDVSSLSGGVINKREKTITWDSSNIPTLALLGAGASGEVSGMVKIKDAYPIKKASDKNFSIVAHAKLESPTVPNNINALRTSSSANSETKIGGNLGVASEIRYRDPDSGIANKGPFPPKVGEGTEYTIHWVLETGATDIKNVEVSSTLESGVIFTGVSKSNIETKPEYDSVTNSIKWKIPRILSGRGVISDMIEATFQVRGTPTQEHMRQFMPIMKETVVTGVDEFTNIELSARDVALSTSLPDDDTVGAGGGKVVQ